MIKILEGDNTFLSAERLKSIVSDLKKQKPEAVIKYINAEDTEASEIIQEYETQDIFSSEKIIILKRLLENKRYQEIIENIYANRETNEHTDIIIWENKKIPKNTKYYKTFNQIKSIESFNQFNKRTFATWAREQAKKRNLSFEPGVLETLIIMTNYEPNAFLNEINKLEILDISKIRKEDLAIYTNDIHDYEIWALIGAINQQNNQKGIIEILSTLFTKNTSPQYIMVMLARNLKQILLISKLLEENKTDKEILSTLKIPPFTLPKMKSIAKKSEYRYLKQIYEKIYRLDYEIKIGNIDGELGLILLTTRFN